MAFSYQRSLNVVGCREIILVLRWKSWIDFRLQELPERVYGSRNEVTSGLMHDMNAPRMTESLMDLRLRRGRAVLTQASMALQTVVDRLDSSFADMVDRLRRCPGRIGVIGVGKSADVGQKLVGTLNSTGTRAYTLDATRALHGDLGMIHPEDLVLLLSHSGESEELIKLLPSLRKFAAGILAITGNARSRLGRSADCTLSYGPIREACPLNLAPSTSATVMQSVGDALALTLQEERGFTAEDFARFHPAGNLGRKLALVDEYMRQGDDLRIASQQEILQKALVETRRPGRRTGALMLVDDVGKLTGLFTDSDLARLLERRQFSAFEEPVSRVMTVSPFTVRQGTRLSDALLLFQDRKISELPVVSDLGLPVGMLDITDLIGLDLSPQSQGEPPAVLKLRNDDTSGPTS
jgi:arabinose-5-phosphate isomerase